MSNDKNDPSLARNTSEQKSMHSLISSSLQGSLFGALIPSIPLIVHLLVVSKSSKQIPNYSEALLTTFIWVGFLAWLTNTIVMQKFTSRQGNVSRRKSPISYLVHLVILIAINIALGIYWYAVHLG